MSFDDAIVRCFWKYAVFTGRARRSEFWWFMLLYLGVCLTAVMAIPVSVALSFVALAAAAALTPPALAVTVRRLHDIGAAGWTLVFLIPVIGQIMVFLWLVRPGVGRANRYGSPAGEERERILLFAR